MLSNHELLESAAGPEELAEGPEGLHLGTLLSQWLPQSLWPSGGLIDSRILGTGDEPMDLGQVSGKPCTTSTACSW